METIAQLFFNSNQISQLTRSVTIDSFKSTKNVPEASQKSHGNGRFFHSGNGRFFIRVKSINNKLYLYHFVLTIKAKDRQLRRSAKEKLSYTARRNVFTSVLPHDPKHSPFLPTTTVSCVSKKKQSPCFSSTHLGGKRFVRVKRLAQEQNTMSLARARTMHRLVWGQANTNHEATAHP